MLAKSSIAALNSKNFLFDASVLTVIDKPSEQ